MKRLLKWSALFGLALVLLGWGFSHGLIIWTVDWDEPAPLFTTNVTIQYVDNMLVANLERYRIEYIALEEMPQHLIEAFVAVEDRRFYQHRGVDYLGVLRAIKVNITTGELAQGGSTITQQLARNIFLNHSRTAKRKLAEASVALQLERRYEKDEILEMYLNQVYFGDGNWGVARAARAYFDKDVAALTLGEAAVLAGLVQAPSAYAPVTSWDLALERQRIVLNRMVSMGFITQQEAVEAANSVIPGS